MGAKEQQGPTRQLDGVSDTSVTTEKLLEYVGAPEGSLRYNKLSANTWRSYKCGIRRWIAFAQMRGLSALEPSGVTLADCIEHYHEIGVGAAAIDTMATAISTVFAWKTNVRLGHMDQVSSLVAAVYATNRITPQNRFYFEPGVVLGVVERDHLNTSLVIQLRRLATLLILCHAMRFTEMESIMKKEVIIKSDGSEVIFMIDIKTERRRKTKIIIKAIPEKPGLCVVETMKSVMGSGEVVPEVFAMEGKKVSASAISRMVKEVMNEAGIPAEVHPYNCKHVGLTKAWKAGASEDELRDVARWSKNSNEFRQHYRVGNSTDKVVRLIVGKEGG
jgi:site-specific recombinase XerD